MIGVPNISSSLGSGSTRMMSTPGYFSCHCSTAWCRRAWAIRRKVWLAIAGRPMSETRRTRVPKTVGIVFSKSLT